MEKERIIDADKILIENEELTCGENTNELVNDDSHKRLLHFPKFLEEKCLSSVNDYDIHVEDKNSGLAESIENEFNATLSQELNLKQSAPCNISKNQIFPYSGEELSCEQNQTSLEYLRSDCVSRSEAYIGNDSLNLHENNASADCAILKSQDLALLQNLSDGSCSNLNEGEENKSLENNDAENLSRENSAQKIVGMEDVGLCTSKQHTKMEDSSCHMLSSNFNFHMCLSNNDKLNEKIIVNCSESYELRKQLEIGNVSSNNGIDTSENKYSVPSGICQFKNVNESLESADINSDEECNVKNSAIEESNSDVSFNSKTNEPCSHNKSIDLNSSESKLMMSNSEIEELGTNKENDLKRNMQSAKIVNENPSADVLATTSEIEFKDDANKIDIPNDNRKDIELKSKCISVSYDKLNSSVDDIVMEGKEKIEISDCQQDNGRNILEPIRFEESSSDIAKKSIQLENNGAHLNIVTPNTEERRQSTINDSALVNEKNINIPFDVVHIKEENSISSGGSAMTEEDNKDSTFRFQGSKVWECLAEDFDWDQYLEDTKSELVPPTAFLHVEQSLEMGVKEGQCLEVLEDIREKRKADIPDTERDEEGERRTSYWPAEVISSCGNLIRLRYLGWNCEFNKCATKTQLEFWSDLSNENLKPMCWSSTHGLTLAPPTSAPELRRSEMNECFYGLESVPREAFDSERREVFARIPPGFLLEVHGHESDPYLGTVAKVTENKGGRLRLCEMISDKEVLDSGEEFDAAQDPTHDSFWLFFLESRIKPLGSIAQLGKPFRYKTSHMEEVAVEHRDEFAFPEMLKFDPLNGSTRPHELEPGMLLELVNRQTWTDISSAVVSKIIDDDHFEVTFAGRSFITILNDPLLLPWDFSKTHNLDAKCLNTKQDENEKSLAVTRHLLGHRKYCSELGFEEGQKLEAVDPSHPERIVIVTVKRIMDHLLLLCSDSDPDMTFYRACTSMDIFPVGWAQANSHPFYVPASIPLAETASVSQEKPSSPLQGSPSNAREEEDQRSKLERGNSNGNSMWCPKLFINHFCYPGPFLSKTKVSKMYQSVGPGPLRLVLRDVIGMTINSAYIPTRVLRELQNLQSLNPSWQSVPMKAKFKRYILKAGVNIPSAAKEIDEFFAGFSRLLMSCPNLWSQNSVGENCPLGCNKQNLSTVSNGKGSLRRKKGSKRRIFYPLKATAGSIDDGGDAAFDEFVDQDDADENYEALSGSEGDSRPSSPSESERNKLKRKRILSSLSITMNSCPRSVHGARDRAAKRSRVESVDTPLADRESPPLPNPNKSDQGMAPVAEDANHGAIYGLEPATVDSDPLEWTVEEVERYVECQPAIQHHAVQLREQEVDGRALLLLNLPSLVHHLGLPHSSAVTLAQYICKVKLAHFIHYNPEKEHVSCKPELVVGQ